MRRGFVDLWTDLLLQILVAYKRLGKRITGFSKNSEVMFDVTKVLKTDFKLLNVILKTAPLWV